MWGISLMFKCFFYCVGKFPSIWVDCFYRFFICFFFCFGWSGGFFYLSVGILIFFSYFCYISYFYYFCFFFFFCYVLIRHFLYLSDGILILSSIYCSTI